MISGHWLPRPVTDDYLDALLESGTRLAELHRELLPLDAVDFGAGGFGARIEPYQASLGAGDVLALNVCVRNPFRHADEACVRLVVPEGWEARPEERRVGLAPLAETELAFDVRAPSGGGPLRRVRIAADLTVGDVRFGQQAEALISVR
jgi:hypothetical protein